MKQTLNPSSRTSLQQSILGTSDVTSGGSKSICFWLFMITLIFSTLLFVTYMFLPADTDPVTGDGAIQAQMLQLVKEMNEKAERGEIPKDWAKGLSDGSMLGNIKDIPGFARNLGDSNNNNNGNSNNVDSSSNTNNNDNGNSGSSSGGSSSSSSSSSSSGDRITQYVIKAPNSVENKYPRSDFSSWIQFNSKENESDEPGVFEKREKIKQTFIKAYEDYDRICHGQDELAPLGARWYVF